MKACILIIFFFRNLSFSSFRIFRSVVLREKRKNCWSFRKRKQLKFISRPRIPAIFVTGGRQLLKASWRYCCSLLFWRISGKVAQALELRFGYTARGWKRLHGPSSVPFSVSPILLFHLYAYPIDLTFCYSQASSSFKMEHGGYTEKTLV